jgi:hypothetical protein
MNKSSSDPSTELGGMINIYISSVLNTKNEVANFMLLFQDDLTNDLLSNFIKSKGDLP